MNRHELKQAMAEGRRVYGTLICSPSPQLAGQIHKAKLDFVMLDDEHMPTDPLTRGWMLRCYRAMGIAPIVRIGSCSYGEAFRAVEHGAEGVLAPYIETVEEVRTLIAAVKYRPLKGERLRGVLDGSIALSPKEEEYFRRYNDGNLVILNIESRFAAENLEALLLPGVDAVFVGPHDLSINLGRPEEYDHPLYLAYIDKIIATCRAKGVGVGCHSAWDLARQAEWARRGMNITMWNSDMGLFVRGINEDFAWVRRELGEDVGEAGGTVTI
ncbi:MAG: aldolase/citrate lyase family protein [Oscillospiraceae bacterium]|nr:aldolase/citrate lyase family protein [Oscillospiraceae bacterium]